MVKLSDNMFAVVGQPVLESENIYETIENYTSQIERDLLRTAYPVNHLRDSHPKDRHPKDRHPKDRHNRDRQLKDRYSKESHPKDNVTQVRNFKDRNLRLPKPEPIVIYEEPDQPIRGDDSPGYVIAYREPTFSDDDGTYETIGSLESDNEKLVQNGNQLMSSHSSLGYYAAQSSNSNLINQPIRAPLRERTGPGTTNQPINGQVTDNVGLGSKKQPITTQGSYQDRMEAVARKVSRLQGRGQLKLSVYVNSGLLTIHVVQARHLSSKALNCNAYVKLSLAPDDIKRTRCKTDVIHDTNNPMFDEKFSFELLEEDVKKRLLVSVWSRDEAERRSEFLGCMSFGINHIRSSKRVVNGWYYLLTEDVGRRKHLRVVDRKQAGSLPEETNNMSPSAHSDLQWMDRHIVVVKRGEGGYGFTVSGTSPPQVCRLEQGSSAESAGLQKNDCIVRINGQNVARAGSDSVARIVRHAQKQVVLEVQRSKVSGRAGDAILMSPWKPTMCSTFLPSPAGSDAEEQEVSSGHSIRSASPPPLRLEDLDEDVPRHLAESRASTGSGGSGHSSGGARYYRESLV